MIAFDPVLRSRRPSAEMGRNRNGSFRAIGERKRTFAGFRSNAVVRPKAAVKPAQSEGLEGVGSRRRRKSFAQHPSRATVAVQNGCAPLKAEAPKARHGLIVRFH
jgi:hypothetical protein